MMKKLLCVAGLALAASSAASAQYAGQHHNGGWRVIGYKIVNGGSDTDTVYTPGRQRYSHIRICAYNAPLRLRDLDVYFANGGRQDVPTRERLNPGTCTRAVDLDGRARDITHVRLKYGQIARGGRLPLVRVTAY